MNLGTFNRNDYRIAADAKIELPDVVPVFLQRERHGHRSLILNGYARNLTLREGELHGDLDATYSDDVAGAGFDLDQMEVDIIDTDDDAIVEIRSARLRAITVRPAPATPGDAP